MTELVADIWRDHSHRRWNDPFCGGLSLPIELRVQRAVLSDVNPYLINFWRWAKAGGQRMLTFPAEANTKEFYLRTRDEFNARKDDPAYSDWAAEVFYYLNVYCFNGLIRFNKSGQFNVPVGDRRAPVMLDDFSAFEPLMQGWEIACVPFSCKQIEPDDLLFLDPPYDSIDPKSKGFTSYYGGVFGFSEQVALVEKVCNHPGPILAANRATPRIMQLYRDYGFSVREVLAPRRIAASGDRTPATEMFATKNL